MRGVAATTVDEYMQAIPSAEMREGLERLRGILREELPGAQEVISYGIPTFKAKGFMVSFAAFKNHCSFFPGYTVQKFLDELVDYKCSKGTIQFSPDRMPPEDLIRRMVRVRWADCLEKGSKPK